MYNRIPFELFIHYLKSLPFALFLPNIFEKR